MRNTLKKALSVVLSLALCLSALLVGQVAVSAATTNRYRTLDLLNEGKLKVQGRTAVTDGTNTHLMLDWSASGVEFTANCQGDVIVDVYADRVGDSTEQGGIYFTVVVDGEVQHADERIPADSNANNWKSNTTNYPYYLPTKGSRLEKLKIAEGLEPGVHTFAIYTQTQAKYGTMSVMNITLDGEMLEAPADNDLYIEVVGDSITAGHGNIANGGTSDEHPLYTDATRGWAYLTARKLNADWSIIAQSGIAATKGVNWARNPSAPIKDWPSMPDVYPYLRFYSDQSTAYDFAREPDVILVALGTNDVWLKDSYSMSDDDIKNGFIAMLDQLREYNPNAKIVWLYGMLTPDANQMVKDAVEEMGGEDEGFYSLELPEDKTGGSSHPGLAIQETYADKVAAYLQTIGIEGGDSGDSGVWDGSKPSEKPEFPGSGEADDPYLISTGEQLYWAISNDNEGVYFKLTRDIVLNDITVSIDGESVTVTDSDGQTVEDCKTLNQWNTQENSHFKGVLDGNGHVVRGMVIEGTREIDSSSVENFPYGLITKVGANTEIRNLGLEDSYINMEHSADKYGVSVGGLVGAVENGSTVTLENCYVGESVWLHGDVVGGLVGNGGTKGPNTITNCYSLATLTYSKGLGSNRSGGIFGGCWSIGNESTVVTNCYANTNLYGNASPLTVNCYGVGALIKPAPEGSSYTERQADKMQGIDGSDYMRGLGDSGAYFIATGYPMLKLFGGRSSDVWDGFFDTELAGQGDEEDPYLISNAGELGYVIRYGGGADNYYRLTDDIVLNDLKKINWVTGKPSAGYVAIPWFATGKNSNGRAAKNFQGNIDGDGHVIYGLYNYATPAAYQDDDAAALIPRVENNTTVTVQNLGLATGYISYTSTAAGLIGWNRSSTIVIDNCFVAEDVTVSGHSAGGFLGSGVSTINITDSYSVAKLSNAGGKAGMVANFWSSTVTAKNCYSSGKVSGNAKLTDDSENYFENVTAKGDAAITAVPGIGDAFVRTEGYPALRIFTDYGDDLVWNGLGEKVAKGSGVDADPYLIENAAQLAYVIADTAGTATAAYYKLTNDIYLNDVSEGWLERDDNMTWITTKTPLVYGNASRALYGHYDGDGHVVYGVYYPEDATTPDAGLFPIFANGEIKNIGVSHSQIVSNQCAGGIIGLVSNNTGVTVSGCFADDTVTVTQLSQSENYACAGGVVGQLYQHAIADISDCYSAAAVKAYRYNGELTRQNGIIGAIYQAKYTVKNCYSLGSRPFYVGDSSSATTNADQAGSYQNVYTDLEAGYTLFVADAFKTLDRSAMTGENALDALEGFSGDIWYAVKDETKAPMLRVRGTALNDVDENGVFEAAKDLSALRKYLLLDSDEVANTDINRDGSTDIRDLIAFKKLAAEA